VSCQQLSVQHFLLLLAAMEVCVLLMSNDHCYCMLCMQVAEDNRINQKVLRMMLQANCAELTIVSDGQQAVDAYNKVMSLVLLLLLA
jgi:PleD family two-component response regulator